MEPLSKKELIKLTEAVCLVENIIESKVPWDIAVFEDPIVAGIGAPGVIGVSTEAIRLPFDRLVSVIVHELIHLNTGEADVTTEFESALSATLGVTIVEIGKLRGLVEESIIEEWNRGESTGVTSLSEESSSRSD